MGPTETRAISGVAVNMLWRYQARSIHGLRGKLPNPWCLPVEALLSKYLLLLDFFESELKNTLSGEGN